MSIFIMSNVLSDIDKSLDEMDNLNQQVTDIVDVCEKLQHTLDNVVESSKKYTSNWGDSKRIFSKRGTHISNTTKYSRKFGV